jgi:hypothetical protein
MIVSIEIRVYHNLSPSLCEVNSDCDVITDRDFITDRDVKTGCAKTANCEKTKQVTQQPTGPLCDDFLLDRNWNLSQFIVMSSLSVVNIVTSSPFVTSKVTLSSLTHKSLPLTLTIANCEKKLNRWLKNPRGMKWFVFTWLIHHKKGPFCDINYLGYHVRWFR